MSPAPNGSSGLRSLLFPQVVVLLAVAYSISYRIVSAIVGAGSQAR